MASLVPSSQERAEGHLLRDKGNGELVGGRESAKMTQPVCPVQELLPAKDVKAMFVSELSKDGKKTLVRKEVYIKNGDKVRNMGF